MDGANDAAVLVRIRMVEGSNPTPLWEVEKY